MGEPNVWRGGMQLELLMWKRTLRVIVSSVLGVALVFGGLTVVVSAGTATESVKSTINEVIRILENQELKKPEQKEQRRRQLEKVIGNRFDYEEMAKRTLGAHWAKLNDTDRREFVGLFTSLLTNTYADKITGYSGEQVHYLNERLEEGGYAEVRTKIVSGKAEIPLDYRLLNKSSDWRVYDVIVDGVSLVNNYRGQFTKIIRSSSYADLVEQLRKKSEKIKSP
ncbi:MAG TPA: ABC transporter substrate-binding protein [Nitrospiraceae bacterium]|nr:ABC transporter substrate-binding protein [Nitrospiraceae bacterium]